MDQQKLPNVTLAIILSCLGFVCCCVYGLPAVILSVISLIVLNNDKKKYIADPEKYSNYGAWKTAKIISIIVLIIGLIFLTLMAIALISYGGPEGLQKALCEWYAQNGIEVPYCE